MSQSKSVAPFAGLPPGTRIPQEWPADVDVPSPGYLGWISDGRVHYVAIDDAVGTFFVDRLDEAYCFKTAEALIASFAFLWNFSGLSTRFISEDGSVPAELATRVTKLPRRRLEPLRVTQEIVRKVLRRETGGSVTQEAATAALAGITASIAKIETDANNTSLRSDGHEELAEGVRLALVEAEILPRSAVPR